MNNQKCPYICGPLTDLDEGLRDSAMDFYEAIANLTLHVGPRAFVPHEHFGRRAFVSPECFDPTRDPDPSPTEVDGVERRQITQLTSVLIVVALAPTWGGGIEVEMARASGVPVIILCEKEKLEKRLISRLLRGNPAVRQIITYVNQDDTLQQLKAVLEELIPPTL